MPSERCAERVEYGPAREAQKRGQPLMARRVARRGLTIGIRRLRNRRRDLRDARRNTEHMAARQRESPDPDPGRVHLRQRGSERERGPPVGKLGLRHEGSRTARGRRRGERHFIASVVAPALEQPEGLPRLRSLVDSWLDYVERRVFPGGCFMVATLSEFDSRPGAVRDALARARRGWLGLLERQVKVAQAEGDLPDSPAADMVAFEVDALLAAANVSRNLSDDTAALAVARDLIALRLGSAQRQGGADWSS